MENTQDWYQSWFDTPHYSLLYRKHDDEEAGKLMEALVKKLDPPKDAFILDLPCGEGRHAVQIHKLGFQVQGMDLSKTLIDRAKLKETEGLSFKVHDMRRAIPKETFDLVLNLYTSFGYFKTETEDLKMLNSIHAGLKKGGTMVLDFLNMNKVLPNLVEFEVRIINGIRYDIRRKLENNFLFKRITVSEKIKSFNYFERIRILGQIEFADLFKKSGFKLKEILGSYELDTFNPGESDRMIFILKKE